MNGTASTSPGVSAPARPGTLEALAAMTFKSAVALTAALLVIGALWRWDQIAHLRDPRWQIILSLLGMIAGTGQAVVQLRGRWLFPRLARVSLLVNGYTLFCWLVLVWTGAVMVPLTWRIWWIAGIACMFCTHLIWLRLSTGSQRGHLKWFTICARIRSSRCTRCTCGRCWRWLSRRRGDRQ
jgi:hypothetical protein